MTDRKGLDETAFVADVAEGGYSRAQLAERHDISRGYVDDLLAGRRRPRIARHLAELRRIGEAELRHRLRRLRDKAVETLDAAMDGETSTTALNAAKEILNRTLPAGESSDDDDPTAGVDLTELSPATRRRVLAELGGPTDEDDAPDSEDPA
jgi:transcriptional regulator with XRE-family HTH domain